MKHKAQSLQQIFETQIEDLAITLSPASLRNYRNVTRNLLRYLAMRYPRIRALKELRRDPHILAWLHHLAARQPPLNKATRQLYLVCMRRLLNDLAGSGKYALHEKLIVRTDFPHLDHYLPKSLSPEDDQLLQQHLRAQDNRSSNALLLLRHTGMRVGELLRLPTDCLRHLSAQQWALHVPLGKLHTERLVPVDEQVRHLHARLLLLRQENDFASSCNLLLPYRTGHWAAYHVLREALIRAAQQAGCSQHVTLHRLRHTYATTMLRAGVSLPALMILLGHHSLNMTMRYLEVTQVDLQREYYDARQNMATRHAIPQLTSTPPTAEPTADLHGILQSMIAVHHLVEMFRRQLSDEKSRRTIARLINRLVKITTEFRHLIQAP